MHQWSIDALKRALDEAQTDDDVSAFIRRYSSDRRLGVQRLVSRGRLRLQATNTERTRLGVLYALEDSLRATGHVHVAGLDEVGRGALAGPLSVGACILPASPRLAGLDDSKRLTPRAREDLSKRIREVAICVTVAHVEADEVDAVGISSALRTAMLLASDALEPSADHLVIDGHPQRIADAETAVIKGDSTVAAVAAASIVAKVERDALMKRLAEEFPLYGFEMHKGYGTAQHLAALAKHGPSPVHRRSFRCSADWQHLF